VVGDMKAARGSKQAGVRAAHPLAPRAPRRAITVPPVQQTDLIGILCRSSIQRVGPGVHLARRRRGVRTRANAADDAPKQQQEVSSRCLDTLERMQFRRSSSAH
jgi:hypothetical protein